MPRPLEIPEFLKIPQADRKAAWDNYRVIARPASPVTSADEDWRRERDRIYDEAAKDRDSDQS